MKTVLVTCGLSDAKLSGKLGGLILSRQVNRIILIRKTPLSGDKIVNVNPPHWLGRSRLLFEMWRFCSVLFYGLSRRADLFIGIQAQMHGVVAVFAAALLGANSALWLIGSDLLIYSKKSLFAPLIRSAIRRADTVYVMGEFSRQLVEEICGRKCRVFVQQVVCDLQPAHRTGLHEKKWDAVFAGNFVDVKNPLGAIAIFSKVHEVIPSARFCMIGDGNLMDSVTREIARQGLVSHIDVLGHVSDPSYYIGASKVLVMPSKSEGLPSVLIEASTLGVPVIASSVGEISYLAKDCIGISTATPEDIESFVDPALRILSDQNSYRQASDAIFEFGRRHCDNWSTANQRGVWERAFLDQQ